MLGAIRIGRTVAMAGVAAGLVLGTASCSVTVPQADVETTIETELGKQIPNIGQVSCPSDLDAEVGKTLRCEFVVEGQPVDAVATVTSVEGSTANFDITTEARPVAKALLETKVRELVEPQLGVPVESLTCDGDLEARTGATQSCLVAAGGESLPLAVTVSSIEGGLINFTVNEA
ncbi:MAG: DUF4333 domain-containing protein [Pseudonocardia sp.]